MLIPFIGKAHNPFGSCARRLVLLVVLEILFKDGDDCGGDLQGYLDGSEVLFLHGVSLLVSVRHECRLHKGKQKLQGRTTDAT